MRPCLLITFLFLVCIRAHGDNNLILNGSYEGTTYQKTFSGYTDTLPTSWTNSPPTSLSNLDVFANGSGPGVAESGTHYIAFQSTESNGTQDCLNQIISTTPGQKYTISFWVGMTASAGSQFGMTLEWDSGGANDTTLGAGTFFYHPTNSPAEAYTLFSYTETASSDFTSVYFHGADATGAVLLDNVSITSVAVPEPNVLGLISASGLMLLALRRRIHRACW
jgi:hypothetical protein